MMVFSAQLAKGVGARPPSLTLQYLPPPHVTYLLSPLQQKQRENATYILPCWPFPLLSDHNMQKLVKFYSCIH